MFAKPFLGQNSEINQKGEGVSKAKKAMEQSH